MHLIECDKVDASQVQMQRFVITRTYCYGVMLHDLGSQSTESIFKAWNTAVKLTWNVPRDTYTYIVENLLGRNFQSLRNQIYSRYSRFFQSLLNSSSREVSFLANIVSRDCQSVTAKNVEHAVGCTTMRIKAGLKKPPAPQNDEWRLPLLLKMLDHRRHEESLLHETENLSKMIDSLCNSQLVSIVLASTEGGL